MKTRVLAAVLALALLPAPPQVPAAATDARAAEPHLLIVGGLGGEDYYSELFHRWVETLAEIGSRRLGLSHDHLIRLEDAPPPLQDSATAPSRKENVLGAIHRLARRSAPGDVVAIVLLGHGAARGDRAQFNLPGPDLSAAELDHALGELKGRTVAVVVAAPASAPFIDRLSGPDRIVITATSSASENQHTRFGGHFVDALAGDPADTDKDGRVSLLEAFDFATREVARSFETDGTIRTEHALLDDDGDRSGSRDPGTEGGDGHLAARTYLAAPAHGPGTAAGARALALDIEARRLVDRIEALKRDKRTLEPDDYFVRLEGLLVELAMNRRAYRRLE